MRKPGKRKLTLRDIEAKPQTKVGACFGLRAAYLSDRLHKGSEVWIRHLEPRQSGWASYLGFDSFHAMPLGEQELVKLWIANWIIAGFYLPQDINTSMIEVRKSLSALERLTKELLSRKGEKDVTNANEYLQPYRR